MPTLEQCRRIKSAILSQRSIREARLRELRRFICPWRGIFTGKTEDAPTHREMLRFTRQASSASLRSASGMTSGMTPSNAPWFKCAFANADLIEATGARPWLDCLDARIAETLTAGGFYQAIQNFNLDLVWAGSALIFCESDADSTARYECLQHGTWAVAMHHTGRLHKVLRQLSLAPWDMEELFGKAPLSPRARERLANGSMEPATVWHLVCPADDGGPHAYASLYWEEGADNFLSQSGYYEMPFFFTSWHEGVTAYGTGPGDDALPDAMQLDKLERHKLEGLAKIVSPPVLAPPSMKGNLNLRANAINFLPENAQVRPALDLTPYAHALPQLREEIQTVGMRIDDALLASIFSSMPLSQRPAGMSATEFLERKRESLQQLGPVISAYEPNVLTPLLFRTLQICDRANLLPPPPPSLAGADLLMQMQFISPMANALRQTSSEAARALFQDVAMIAQGTGNREVLDKIDTDQLVDELATALGAPGSTVRADEDVALIRQSRAEAEAQANAMQAQLHMAEGQAAAMKDGAAAMKDEAAARSMLAALAGGQ